MPAVRAIHSKFSEAACTEVLRELSSDLPTILSQSGFSEQEKNAVLSDDWRDLTWLKNQEINLILACSSKEDRKKMLSHRIRFSLLPRLRISTRVPAYILIEPTSVCNLRCPMCFQTDKSFTTSEFMGKDRYRLVQKDC